MASSYARHVSAGPALPWRPRGRGRGAPAAPPCAGKRCSPRAAARRRTCAARACASALDARSVVRLVRTRRAGASELKRCSGRALPVVLCGVVAQALHAVARLGGRDAPHRQAADLALALRRQRGVACGSQSQSASAAGAGAGTGAEHARRRAPSGGAGASASMTRAPRRAARRECALGPLVCLRSQPAPRERRARRQRTQAAAAARLLCGERTACAVQARPAARCAARLLAVRRTARHVAAPGSPLRPPKPTRHGAASQSRAQSRALRLLQRALLPDARL